MSRSLSFERCPETGICSIFRGDLEKIDLMPDEVEAIRDAAGDPEVIKEIIAECDDDFAAALTPEEVREIAKTLKLMPQSILNRKDAKTQRRKT